MGHLAAVSSWTRAWLQSGLQMIASPRGVSDGVAAALLLVACRARCGRHLSGSLGTELLPAVPATEENTRADPE
ncbi:hypothetical protein D1Y84_11510 [Acidipila sp. EB88]|nr:hypothetical protein D1Y84_11510 [Acidipila sp. EB88]